MISWEPMKYARISSANEKVFDGRTNDIKDEMNIEMFYKIKKVII